MNDRALPARKAARLVLRKALGLPDDGDDDPTCAEHALVNILEEGRKGIDVVLRAMMHITEEQAESDATKVKAHSTHSAKLAPSVRLSLGHFQCKCSHSPYTFSAKHLKCFAGWALSVQVHEALDT